ncbi:MAG: hypothetical protein OHK0022_19950 [Roseiflexaceae bacterium]
MMAAASALMSETAGWGAGVLATGAGGAGGATWAGVAARTGGTAAGSWSNCATMRTNASKRAARRCEDTVNMPYSPHPPHSLRHVGTR